MRPPFFLVREGASPNSWQAFLVSQGLLVFMEHFIIANDLSHAFPFPFSRFASLVHTRFDILVEVEQIRRVIVLLECRQPRIRCRWVSLADTLLTLLGQEIHVHASTIGPDRLPDLLHTRM